MESIPPALLNGVGVVGLLVVLFWMLATGRLVTRREHETVRADRDYWREIGIKGINTAEKLADQKSAGIAAVESLARDAREVGDDR
jgi:hypothetical protein